MENIVLNNKLECPVVGIGTFMLSPTDAEVSVREALKMGYRLVDTANAYVNEKARLRRLVFPILKESILKSLRRNGKLFLSLFR